MRKIVLGIGIFLASWGLGQLQEAQAFTEGISDFVESMGDGSQEGWAKQTGRTIGGVGGIVTKSAAGLTEGINEGLGNSTEEAVEQLNMLIEKGKDVKEIEEQVKCVKELLTKGFGSVEIEKRCILSVGPDGSFALPSAEKFNQAQTTSLRTFILDALNFVLGFLGIVAVAVIIYSGYTYVTASEDESRAEKAKNMIIWVSIGLVIILVSFAYVNTIITHLPTGGEDERYCSENPDDPDCIGGADTEINGTSAEGDVDSFYQDKGESAEVIIVGNGINLIDGSNGGDISDANTVTQIEVTTPNLLYDGSGSSQRIYADLPTAVNGLYFQIPSAIDGYVEDNLDNRANFIRLKNDSTDQSKTEENCARDYHSADITNKCQFFKLPFTQGGSYSINGEFVDASNVVHNFSRTIVIGQFSAEIQSSSDLLVTTGDSVALSANVENLPYSTTSTYAWTNSCDTDDTSTNQTFTVELDQVGTCDIGLTVTNSLGWTTTDSATFNIEDEATTETISAQVLAAATDGSPNVSPTSDGYGEQIYVDLAAGAAGVDFKIVGAVDGSVTIDGVDLALTDVDNTAIETNSDDALDNFTYNFYDSGSYALTGTYKEDANSEESFQFSKTIIVGDLTPTIVAASTPDTVGQEVTFTANVTTPSGSNITGYTWSGSDACAGVNGNSKTLTYKFEATGTCTLTLTATNNLGWSETTEVTYTIAEDTSDTSVSVSTNAQVEAVSADTSANVYVGNDGYDTTIYADSAAGAGGLTFTVVGATSGTVTINNAELTLTDSDSDDNANNFSYTFREVGTYSMSGTYQDESGGDYSFSKTVIIGNISAEISENTTVETINDTIILSVVATTPSGTSITSYTWAGDDAGNCADWTDTDTSTQYTFATAGECKVTLTVTNSLGWTDTDEASFIIAEDTSSTVSSLLTDNEITDTQITVAANGTDTDDANEVGYSDNAGYSTYIFADTVAASTGLTFTIVLANGESLQTGSYSINDESGITIQPSSTLNEVNFEYAFLDAGIYDLEGEYTYTYTGTETDDDGNLITETASSNFTRKVVVDSLDVSIDSNLSAPTIGTETELRANVDNVTYTSVSSYAWGCEFWETTADPESDAAGECSGFSVIGSSGSYDWPAAGTYDLTLTVVNSLGWSEVATKTYSVSASSSSSTTTTTTSGTGSTIVDAEAASDNTASGVVFVGNDGLDPYIVIDPEVAAGGVTFTVANAVSGEVTINGNVTRVFSDENGDAVTDNFTHSFYTPGSHSLSGSYYDSAGGYYSFTRTVIVDELEVSIAASFTPTYTGDTVTFTAQTTTPLSTNVNSYSWSCTGTCSSLGDEKSEEYTFSEEGTYTISVTVTNTAGQTASDSKTYEIEENPISVTQ